MPPLVCALSLLLFSISCHPALPALAVSPIGHGGVPSRRGPGPRGLLWRAEALSAPCQQACRANPGQPRDIRCAVVAPHDPYARALVLADSGEIAQP